MAKSLAEQLKAMKKKIEGKAKEVLNNEVADKVIDIGKDSVQTNVYDEYPDPVYKRTYQLRDEAWEKIPAENGVIIRSNRTEKNKKTGKIFQISAIVESGEGYSIPDKNNPPKYGKPRPFMEKTKERVEDSNLVSVELAKELEKDLGIKCKVK